MSPKKEGQADKTTWLQLLTQYFCEAIAYRFGGMSMWNLHPRLSFTQACQNRWRATVACGDNMWCTVAHHVIMPP